MTKIKPSKFDGIFYINNKLATVNLTPGYNVYGEKLMKLGNVEYREWESHRSKPSAAIRKRIRNFPINKNNKILYMGAGSGTTVSHFSDIVGKGGLIYAIEIGDRVLRELLPHADKRKNIVPLLMDARLPQNYEWIEQVDLVYADIAIKDQSIVLIRNAKMFLKPNAFAMIAIKTRSIDVTEKPNIIYKKEREKLESFFNVTDFVTLDPYEKDHGFFVLKRK